MDATTRACTAKPRGVPTAFWSASPSEASDAPAAMRNWASAKVGLKEVPDTLITDIGVGKQQLVEIAKALSKKVQLLILDEPTAALNENDIDALLKLLMEFRKQGMTSIIISHKLNEINKVADSITILRDGGTVETLDCHTEEISEDRIIKGMVGRDMEDRYPAARAEDRRDAARGEELERLPPASTATASSCTTSTSRVRAGEVVGIAGLMGAGRTETRHEHLRQVLGHSRSPAKFTCTASRSTSAPFRKAIDAGLAYVTEDRKHLGLVLIDNIMHNITLANLNGGFYCRRDRRPCGTAASPPTTGRSSTSARSTSIRKQSIFRAATSRRSCCPSGCLPSRRF